MYQAERPAEQREAQRLVAISALLRRCVGACNDNNYAQIGH